MKKNKIIFYTTPLCGECIKVKNIMKKCEINYQEKNVMQDPEARMEMFQKSGQFRVPVIDMRGEMIVGLNRNRMNQLVCDNREII